MKKIVWIFLLMLIFSACATHQLPYIEGKLETQEEYEVVVFDPGFENWFVSAWNPAVDRSNSYYRNWNDQYVTAWNYKATHPGYSEFFNTQINYELNKDYGIAVNRKLFYYFQWVEQRVGILILDGRGPTIM